MSLALSLTRVLLPDPGWYRGDFHCHTHHSDGVHTPAELLEVARLAGLDFFFITDHNSVGAYEHFGESPDVLVLPGIEVTYKRGHYNVFGLTEAAAWVQQVCAAYVAAPAATDPYPTVNALMAEAARAGLLNSINHPLLAPWAWEFPDTDLANVHCLELWNDPSWPDNQRENPRAIAMWTRWLNAGFRITGLGGSDYHRPQPPAGQTKPAERLGYPATYVYADQLSGEAILRAVRARRAYVSLGPRVAFEAEHAGGTADIGADLGPVSGPIQLRATVMACSEPAVARLVANGAVIAEAAIVDAGVQLTATVPAPTTAAWYRLDVEAGDGMMLAITNPIFAGPAVAAQGVYGDLLPG